MYLETVETAKDPEEKIDGTGTAGVGACEGAYSRKSYWKMSNVGLVKSK